MVVAALRRKEVTPDEVAVLATPWTAGRGVRANLGTVTLEAVVPDDPADTREDRLVDAVVELRERLRVDAAARGANALCFSQCTLDPFWHGDSTLVSASGNALLLSEPTGPIKKSNELGEALRNVFRPPPVKP